jgi:acetyl-CoA carboxylase carboxyl transferase subunit alpha
MHDLGLVDQVIPEPVGGAHAHPKEAMRTVADQIDLWLTELEKLPMDALLEARYQKFRTIASAGSLVTSP